MDRSRGVLGENARDQLHAARALVEGAPQVERPALVAGDEVDVEDRPAPEGADDLLALRLGRDQREDRAFEGSTKPHVHIASCGPEGPHEVAHLVDANRPVVAVVDADENGVLAVRGDGEVVGNGNGRRALRGSVAAGQEEAQEEAQQESLDSRITSSYVSTR